MKRGALPLIVAAFLSLAVLMSGSSLLEARLPGGLPFGNALSAASLILPAGAAMALSARGTLMRRLAVVAMALAILWLPFSIALAGNLELNFRGGRGTAWFALTGASFLASVGSLLLAFFSSVRGRRKQG